MLMVFVVRVNHSVETRHQTSFLKYVICRLVSPFHEPIVKLLFDWVVVIITDQVGHAYFLLYTFEILGFYLRKTSVGELICIR